MADEIARRLVVGTGGLGGLYADAGPDRAADAMDAAWELGLRSYDTAPHYGTGIAEERLGESLSARDRASYQLQTKIGRVLIADPSVTSDPEGFPQSAGRRRESDYSAAGVHRSLDGSRTRLQIAELDSVLVHDPEGHLPQALAEAGPELSAMRAAKEISSWGVGTNYVATAAAFLERTDADRILIAGRYTLLDRRAEPLLAQAAQTKTAVLVAAPMNSGLLAGGNNFNYAPAPGELIAAAAAMRKLCDEYGVRLTAAALQFPLRHPGVAQLVIGPRSRSEFADTARAFTTEIPDELWLALDKLVPDQNSFPD